MGKHNEITAASVEISAKDGVAFIEQASPLTRLHYFDGKFLRADAFALEQDYHRQRTRLANIAGGWGAVHGLGISLSGNQLDVGAGLAVTAAGNFVLAVGEMHADLADLLQVAAPAPVGGNAEFADCVEAPKAGVKESAGLAIYEITVGPVEGLCGNEAVYGKLCESACVSDSRHPYWREGVVLRLRPIGLQLPTSSAVALSVTHLRNRVASAYFAAEPWLTPSALSAAGLASDLWCKPASLYGRDEVVIGLLAREAGINRVLDAWSGRRERMDAQARGYWQGRMAMRPWNVFVAQILQFQCQLAGLFDGTGGVIKPADDCGPLRQLLDRTRKELEALHRKYAAGTQKILRQFGDKPSRKDAISVADEVKASYSELYEISEKLSSAELGRGALPRNRLLLNAGFVDLPPAGYLPVVPGKQSLEDQLSRMFGEGVRLHYHAVRHDEIAHLVEQAQHLARISLTRGIDDPKSPEEVEIFVPDGNAIDAQAQAAGTWWQVDMHFEAFLALRLAIQDRDATDKERQQAMRDQVLAQASEAPQTALSLMKGKRSKKTKALSINTNVAALDAEKAKAEAAAAAAESPTGSVNQLAGLSRSNLPALAGLARTESREDGSYGFTMVTAPDALGTEGDMRSNLVYRLKAGSYGQAGVSVQGVTSKLAFYFSGDVAQDPFDLPIGGDTHVTAEMRLMGGVSADASAINGRLTALSQRSAANGFIERLVQIDVSTSSTVFGKVEGPQTSTEQNSMRFNILRKGDAGAGSFALDDEKHNANTSPVFIEWDDSPRRAVMYVMAASAQEAVALRIMKVMARKAAATPAPATAPEAPAAAAAAAAEKDTGAVARQQLLAMNALTGIPGITSADGVAAMNAIVALADAADDPAFLARARRRLFPTLDAPKTQTVRAVHDWVMFRRARTHLYGPARTQEAAPTLEAFQTWHLKLESAKQLELLEAALEKGDAKALAGFKFQRVGILRYRDESAYSEESADRVRQMWAFAQPGTQVLIARVWESAPATGQGWQNHFRLRNMLEQIATLARPPVRGDGALAAIPAPPPPIADGALDGGMLVVTMDTAVELKPHRAILVPYAYYVSLKSAFDKNPDDAWQLLGEILIRDPNSVLDLSLNFNASNQIDADSLKKLREGDGKMMSDRTDFGYQLWVRRIDAAQIDSNTDPVARHKVVSDNVGKGAFVADRFDETTLKLAATDLGAGAQVASVVFYLSVVEI